MDGKQMQVLCMLCLVAAFETSIPKKRLRISAIGELFDGIKPNGASCLVILTSDFVCHQVAGISISPHAINGTAKESSKGAIQGAEHMLRMGFSILDTVMSINIYLKPDSRDHRLCLT